MRYNLSLFTFSALISCVFAAVYGGGGGATVSGPQNSQPGNSAPQSGAGNTLEPKSTEAIAKEVCKSNGHEGGASSIECLVLCIVDMEHVYEYKLPEGTMCGIGGKCVNNVCQGGLRLGLTPSDMPGEAFDPLLDEPEI